LISLAEERREGAHERFAGWYSAQPDNSRAFDALAETQKLARRAAGTDEMRALREEAFHFARQSRRRKILAALGTLGSAAAAAWGLSSQPGVLAPFPSYATGPHERLAVNLQDGSIVTLDAGSRVRIAYTPGQRRVILESGQALFEVAKGQPTPFSVASGGHVVVAHGTVFVVRDLPRGVRVVLVEGAVGVDSGASRVSTMMKPNDVYEDAGAGPTLHHGQDSARYTLWRRGILQFRNERLVDAVAEVNRYLDRPIILSQANLRNLRISGTFHAGDQLAFTSAVSGYFGLRTKEGRTGIVLASEGRDNGSPQP
jgi:transmembrane sensor